MIRRFGTPPIPEMTHRHRPGAYAVLVRDDRVLLTFQELPKPEFQLPGGGIDRGEDVIPALRREIVEETGWKIGTPMRLGVFREFTRMPEYDIWAEKVCHVYIARPSLQFSEPTEAGHHCRWVSFEDAVELVPNQGSKYFLREAFVSYC